MIARFVKDGLTFDVNTGAYSLGGDFIPPSSNFAYALAAGTSANVWGGANLTGLQAQNRDWTFSIRILASSEGDVNVAFNRLQSFLTRCFDPGEAMRFEFQPLDLPKPAWGTLGALVRYEVVTATASMGELYTSSLARQRGAVVYLSLNVKPLAEGEAQHLAGASGAVWYDSTGCPNGQAWGLRIMPAATNKIVDPAFMKEGLSNDFYYWTAGTNLLVQRNTNPRYIYEGSDASALLTSTAATLNTFTIAATAGNTNKHSFTAIVARPDGAPVTSADCQIYYNAALTTTFLSIGNGLYLAYADNITGIAASTPAGLIVKQGRAVYLVAFGMVEGALHTVITHGNMPGNTWTDPANVPSTSSRTKAAVTALSSANIVLDYAGWSVHVTWRPDYSSATAGTRHLFSLNTEDLYFNGADGKFYVSGAQIANSPAFAAGDIIDLIVTFGAGGKSLYINGVSVGNVPSYTPDKNLTSSMYIGQQGGVNYNHAEGLLLGFDFYDQELSAAEAAAVYAAVQGSISSGYAWGRIPLINSTTGASFTLYNCLDATYKNHAVAYGLSGNMPAKFKTTVTSASLAKSVWLCIHPDYDLWRNPALNFYKELGGNALAGLSNGDYQTISAATPRTAITISPQYPSRLSGEVHGFAVLASSTATTTATVGLYAYSNYGVSKKDDATLALDTSYRLFYIGSIDLGEGRNALHNEGVWGEDFGVILAMNFTSTPNTIRADFAQFLNGDVQKISPVSIPIPGGSGYTTAPNRLTVDGNQGVYNKDSTSSPSIIGNDLVFYPNAYNTITAILADDKGVITQTDSVTCSATTYTPRWTLAV